MSKRRFLGWNTIYGADGEHPTPYLTRIWIGRLRLHIFHRGDADPECHDHPWDFWTFPLTSYVEQVAERGLLSQGDYDPWAPRQIGYSLRQQVVRSFRLHHRPAEHCHRVLGRYRGWDRGIRDQAESDPANFGDGPVAEHGSIITIVWQGRPRRKWGFLRNRDGRWCWTPWKDYVFGGGKQAPCEDGSGE